MSSEWEALVTLTRRDVNTLSVLVKDPQVWEAFLLLLKHEEAKIFAQLHRGSADDIIRLSGKFELLQQLKKLREFIHNATN